ncbi:MAG: hypothetical protein NTW94_04220 [Legionellales bacterium]|nr:hypothetical protein [Legionellales bacterium]
MPVSHEEKLRQYIVNSRLKEAWEADINQAQLLKHSEKIQREMQIRELDRRVPRAKKKEEYHKLMARLVHEIDSVRQRGYDTFVAAMADTFYMAILACEVAEKSGFVGHGIRMIFGADHHSVIDLIRMKMKSPPKHISELPKLQFDLRLKADGTLDKAAMRHSLSTDTGELISKDIKTQLEHTIEHGVELWLASRHYKPNPDLAGGFVSDDYLATPLTKEKFDELALDPVRGIGAFFVHGFPMDIEHVHAPSSPRLGG